MRYRFVDRITKLEPGKNIHCQYCWAEGLEIFDDHFPAFPVVPGVLLTEMMGQSAALCIESKHAEYGSPMLIQINNARFRNWVRPGYLLDVYAEVLSALPRLAKVKAKTEYEGKTMATVELLFSFQSREHLGLPEVDPVLTAYWSNPDNNER